MGLKFSEGGRKDWARAFFLCAVLSAIVHFAGLGTPDRVIWDETGYGLQINQYCGKRSAVFDIHPPHAKLLLAASACLLGYDGNFLFLHNGQPYAQTSPWVLRAWPAWVGTCVPLVLFLLLMDLGVSLRGCVLGALALTLENGLLLQTRTIAIDGFLVLTFLLTWLAWRRSWGFVKQNFAIGGVGFAVAGASAALSWGTKSTGLLAFALLGLLALAKSWETKTIRLPLYALGIAFASGTLVYLLGWYLHFQLAVMVGSEMAYFERRGNFWFDFWGLQRAMLHHNYYLGEPHSSSSRWWGWPLLRSPVHYWHEGEKNIYFLGNPSVWWGALGVHLFALGDSVRRRKIDFPYLFCLGLFLIAYLPYAFIPRVLFLYHFLPSLTILVVGAILWLETAGFFRDTGQPPVAYAASLAAVVLGFLFVSPVTFGFAWSGMESSWIHSFIRWLT